jgi:hypothetical protein
VVVRASGECVQARSNGDGSVCVSVLGVCVCVLVRVLDGGGGRSGQVDIKDVSRNNGWRRGAIE